jgi:hypothetical protein
MKLTLKLTMMMALASGMAWAGGTLPARTVTVCSRRTADSATLYRAQGAASKMFATAGVKIDWREPRPCPAGVILISLSESAPASDHPGALAYALPCEGNTHCRILRPDRETERRRGSQRPAYASGPRHGPRDYSHSARSEPAFGNGSHESTLGRPGLWPNADQTTSVHGLGHISDSAQSGLAVAAMRR